VHYNQDDGRACLLLESIFETQHMMMHRSSHPASRFRFHGKNNRLSASKRLVFKAFWGTETVSQKFPTVSQNAVEPRLVTNTKIPKTSFYDHLGLQMK